MQLSVWNAESRGGSREHVLHADTATGKGTFGVLWPIEKHCKAPAGWAVQNMGGWILMIYTSYDVFLRVTLIAPALKFLVALNFFNHD